MYDCKFNVEFVSLNITKAPKTTAGIVVRMTIDTLKDWKFADNIKKITTMATKSPDCKLSNVSVNTLLKPMGSTVSPLGNSPSEAMAFLTSSVAVPKSFLYKLAVTESVGKAPKLSFSP